MTREVTWLESFTGVAVATGAMIPGADPETAAARFEAKKIQQRLLLDEIRKQLNQFKSDFQNAMSEKLKSGKMKGQQLLKETATQLDEIEAEELSIADLVVSEESKKLISEGASLVTRLSFKLDEATFKYAGESEALFSDIEKREEFWTPLMRERILPETYIPAKYSETQRMLDETNAAYLERVEEEKAKGTLTPRLNRGKEILKSSTEILMLSGDLVGTFGAGTEQAKLAVTVLNTTATVVAQGSEIYDKATAGEFADASSSALETMGVIATSVLAGFGVDKNVTNAVGKSLTAGSKAIMVGNAFAKGVDGAEEGLTLMGVVVQRALEAAIGLTDGQAKTGLEAAKATVPALFTQAAIGMNLRQKIYDEDYSGIAECLSKSFLNALTSVEELRALNEKQGKSIEEQQAIQKRLDLKQQEIEKYGQLGFAGLQMTINAAIASKRGDFMDAITGIIDSVGEQLTVVLTTAGVDPSQAKMISQFYIAASSAPRALRCLANPDFDVSGAIREISVGIDVAFKQAAPNNQKLIMAGNGLVTSLQGISKGISAKKSFDQGKYDEAMNEVVTAVQDGIKDGLKMASVEGGEESVDQFADSLKEALSNLDDEVLATNLEKAKQELEEDQKKVEAQLMRAEAEDLLSEAQAEIDELSEAQRFGAESSNIDKLVAKLLRDRMVLELATQLSQGGAAFVSKFVPVLGTVSAGIKLAAQLHAAGLRAQQLHRWVQNQDDLEAAQSSLSSSAGNFVHNQGQQLAHYAAQAFFAAAQLAAEIVKVSGVAAPVGLGLSALASAGAKVEEIALRHFKQEELEKAWEITSQALRNPTNRKLGLKARKLNPSLAKYAIAWGATELRDPLARNALRACNLTDASLEDKNTDVNKVVFYLETFYTDDQTLYRELDETPDWVPKDLTLSLSSWSRLKRNSVTEGKLLEVKTGRLESALAQLDLLAEGPAWQEFNTKQASWRLAVKSIDMGSESSVEPKSDKPKPDNKSVLDALTKVEIEVNVKSRLVSQLQTSLQDFTPQPPGSDKVFQDSAAAMAGAVKVLLDQTRVLARTIDGETQTVVEMRQLLTAA